ncbi:MAG: NADH-quinone oxidoreductase subunit J [Dehalococcoidia bacterium]|nr:NADH-quinone oxidoreductase subunit J [Dehalococcoidia bacterium]
MSSIGVVVAFWLLAGVTMGGALLVFLSRNLMHAVLFLVFAFIGMAGLFVTLSADFIAVAQVLIYAGAVSVLLVFAVMLTPLASRDNGNSLFMLPGVLLGLGFAAVSAFVAVRVGWPQLTGDAVDAQSFVGTVRTIGSALLGTNLLPFELASVLLLVALVGAIALVNEDEPR